MDATRATPGADVAGDPGGEMPRWARAAVFASLALTFWTYGLVELLMERTGLPGTLLTFATHLPLHAAAALGITRVRMSPALAWMAALCAALSASSFLGEYVWDGLLRCTAMPTALSWAVVFAAWPSELPRTFRWCLGLSALMLMLEALNKELFPRPSFMLAFLTLGLYVHLRVTGRLSPKMVSWGMVLLPLILAVIIRSTFRAASFAAMGVLLWGFTRMWEGRVALVLAVALGGAYVATAPAAEPSYSRDVARDDYVNRFRTVDEDRFSGRGDIWEGLWADVKTQPRWLLTGLGYGDIDVHVAEVNPQLHAVNRRGTRAIHTHNQVLDVLLATGLPGTLLLLAVVAACARRSSLRDPTLAYGLGLALVGTANVLLTDASGSTAALGLYLSWFGATRRPTEAARYSVAKALSGMSRGEVSARSSTFPMDSTAGSTLRA